MTHENWNGFNPGVWQNEINVRDFIQTNYKEYKGDGSFLCSATERTKNIMQKVNELFNFDPSFADILWDEIVKHEDTLWKNLIYRHIGRIENKVEELSFLLTDED